MDCRDWPCGTGQLQQAMDVALLNAELDNEVTLGEKVETDGYCSLRHVMPVNSVKTRVQMRFMT